MKKFYILSIITAVTIAAFSVQAHNNIIEGTEINAAAVKGNDLVTSGDIQISYSGSSFFIQTGNQCSARYLGNNEVDHYSWRGNWEVVENLPHSSDYSSVYLQAVSPSISNPSTLQVTVHFVGGGSTSELFEIPVTY